MSSTPRTDAVDAGYYASNGGLLAAIFNLTRQLERELQQAQAQIETLREYLSRLERTLRKAKLGLDHALMFSTMPAESRKTLNEICDEIRAVMKEATALQPKHLVRRGLKPDGTYPLENDDEEAWK